MLGHSFAYVAHFLFLRDVWIRTQRAAVASRWAINLAFHLPNFATNVSSIVLGWSILIGHLLGVALFFSHGYTYKYVLKNQQSDSPS